MAGDLKRLVEKLGGEAEVLPAEVSPGSEIQDDTTPTKPQSEPPSEDVLAQIEKLGQLHDAGVLTDEEFQAKKAELLARL